MTPRSHDRRPRIAVAYDLLIGALRSDGAATCWLPLPFDALSLELLSSLGFEQPADPVPWRLVSRYPTTNVTQTLMFLRAVGEATADADAILGRCHVEDTLACWNTLVGLSEPDFISAAKFLCAWPMAKWLRNDLPAVPACLSGCSPMPWTGAFRRHMRNIVVSRGSSSAAAKVCLAFLQGVKRGCAPVAPSVVAGAFEKHHKALTQQLPIISDDSCRDMSEYFNRVWQKRPPRLFRTSEEDQEQAEADALPGIGLPPGLEYKWKEKTAVWKTWKRELGNPGTHACWEARRDQGGKAGFAAAWNLATGGDIASLPPALQEGFRASAESNLRRDLTTYHQDVIQLPGLCNRLGVKPTESDLLRAAGLLDLQLIQKRLPVSAVARVCGFLGGDHLDGLLYPVQIDAAACQDGILRFHRLWAGRNPPRNPALHDDLRSQSISGMAHEAPVPWDQGEEECGHGWKPRPSGLHQVIGDLQEPLVWPEDTERNFIKSWHRFERDTRRALEKGDANKWHAICKNAPPMHPNDAAAELYQWLTRPYDYDELLSMVEVQPGEVCEERGLPPLRYQRVLRSAAVLLEHSDGTCPARVAPVLEPLKVRLISKGPAVPYLAATPAQKAMWGHLQRFPQFALTGCPVDASHLQGLCWRLRDIGLEEEFPDWVSGDYAAATDGLSTQVNRLAFDSFLRHCGASADECKVWSAVLGEHCLSYPVIPGLEVPDPFRQTNGQLMGSPLSFPILCVLNLVAYWRALEEYTGRSFSIEELPVLVNGDDILFRSNAAFYEVWKRHITEMGFTLSLGKNYIHRSLLTVNSEYWLHSRPNLGYGPVDVFKPVGYLNVGLLVGNQTGLSGTSLRPENQAMPWYQKASAAIEGCSDPARTQNRVKHYYRDEIRSHTNKGEVNLYAAPELGGLGMSSRGSDHRFTSFQRKLAYHLHQENWSKSGQLVDRGCPRVWTRFSPVVTNRLSSRFDPAVRRGWVRAICRSKREPLRDGESLFSSSAGARRGDQLPPLPSSQVWTYRWLTSDQMAAFRAASRRFDPKRLERLSMLADWSWRHETASGPEGPTDESHLVNLRDEMTTEF